MGDPAFPEAPDETRPKAWVAIAACKVAMLAHDNLVTEAASSWAADNPLEEAEPEASWANPATNINPRHHCHAKQLWPDVQQAYRDVYPIPFPAIIKHVNREIKADKHAERPSCFAYSRENTSLA